MNAPGPPLALDPVFAAHPRVAWPTVALVTAFSLTALVAPWLVHRGLSLPAALGVYTAGWCAFTALHEAAHGNVGRARWLNALVGELAATLLLCRYLAFRQIHHRHHRHTNHPTLDPDRFTGEGPSWQRPLRLATTDLHYYRVYDPRRIRASRLEAALSWSTAGLLAMTVGALFATGHGGAFVLVWVLPIRAAMFTAALVADLLPHMRPGAPPRAGAALAHTAQVAPSAWFDLVSLCHSHHLLHHLWPRVPFYRLPAVWRRHGDALRAAGATVRAG